MDRTRVHEWKRWFETPGSGGLTDLPRAPSRVRGPWRGLSADTLFVGLLTGVGKVYLHAVVDIDAFGFLHVSTQPKAAVAVLHNDVLRFYRELDVSLKAALTDNGRACCGTVELP